MSLKRGPSKEYLLRAWNWVFGSHGMLDEKVDRCTAIISSTKRRAVKKKARWYDDNDVPHAERTLREIEMQYQDAIRTKVAAERRVEQAMKVLRSAEEAFVLVSDSLVNMQNEFGEGRTELELALARTEVSLVLANAEAKAALSNLKECEEVTNELMLCLRQAEIDHENFHKKVQRTLQLPAPLVENDGSSVERASVVLNQDMENPSLELGALQSSTPIKTTTDFVGRDTLCSELESLGITVSSAVSDALVRQILLTTRVSNKSALSVSSSVAEDGKDEQTGLPLIVSGPPRVGAPPASVRLICIGKAAQCLGEELSSDSDGPRDARALLVALGGTAPVQVCCQHKHALMVAQSGEIFSWGDISGGKLGLGSIAAGCAGGGAYVAAPVVIEALRGVIVTQVASSAYHCLALTADGQVFAWGSADGGVLGLGEVTAAGLPMDPTSGRRICDMPRRVDAFDGVLTRIKVREVACSDSFSLAVTEGGLVYSWGSASEGCLGLGEVCKAAGLRRDGTGARYADAPVVIEALKGQRVVKVACGASHCLACTERGHLWAWGSAEYGKLGIGDVSHLPLTDYGQVHAPSPILVAGWGGGGAEPDPLDQRLAVRVCSLSCGPAHSLIVSHDGQLFACGSGLNGKLGLGSVRGAGGEEGPEQAVMLPSTRPWWPYCPSPTLVEALAGKVVVQAVCGQEHSIAATADGEVHVWGLFPASLNPAHAAPGSLAPPAGEGRGAVRVMEVPTAVEGLPWGCVQVSTSEQLTLLLYTGLDSLDYDPLLAVPASADPLAGRREQTLGWGQGGVRWGVLQHLERLLQTGELSDVTLVAQGGKTLAAHRAMLAAVPRLKSLMAGQPHPTGGAGDAGHAPGSVQAVGVDGQGQRLELADCSVAALRAALGYVYTGAVVTGESVGEALEVLHCASVLGLSGLTRAAARRLEMELSPSSVAGVWQAAHAHALPRLKARCVGYILERYDDCKPEAQPHVRDLMRTEPAFFDALLSALAPTSRRPAPLHAPAPPTTTSR